VTSPVIGYGARPPVRRSGESLADVLERVLDKGVVIAGDIAVNVLDIELLTLKVRLLVASADTARSMGIDWWEHDPFLSGRARADNDDRNRLEEENEQLRQRLERLESRMAALPETGDAPRNPDGGDGRI
jgi:hypothetical protein